MSERRPSGPAPTAPARLRPERKLQKMELFTEPQVRSLASMASSPAVLRGLRLPAELTPSVREKMVAFQICAVERLPVLLLWSSLSSSTPLSPWLSAPPLFSGPCRP